MRDIFPGDGEMAALCRSHDWTATPLGPPDGWPRSLKTIVSTLLASKHPMFLFWGPEHIQFYNDAYRPSLGEDGRHPAALGAQSREFWTEIWHVIEPQIEQVRSGGEATWHENQLVPIHRDGRLEDVYWTYIYSPVHGDDGSIQGVLVVTQETTAAVRAEAEARALAQRLSTTLESITDAFFTLDRAWRLTFINAEAERVLERSRDELLGRNVWDEFPEAVGMAFYTQYHRAMNEGTTATFRYHHPPLDRWFDIRAYPSSEGLAVYFRDITAEREAERRLREQAELLDKAQDAILVRELDHTLVYWSAGAERLYGWSREEVGGMSTRDLLYQDAEPFETATTAVLERGEWTGELEQVCKDGSLITVEGRWSLVRDDEGEPYRILAINTDVTERQQVLTQFLRAQRMESIGTLAGGIAHDLNNVLAPILLSIGLLKEDIHDPALVETLLAIESSAERGADMVRQVLGFARGVDRADMEVDLARTLADLARIIRDTFPKSTGLAWEIPDELWPLRGDPTQMHQVFMNLLVNARDAMPDGGHVTLRAENVELDDHYASMHPDARAGPHVCITVTDKGTGMSADVAAQVFDPFFTTKEVGHGTGLGLSTVAAIVKGHGGFVNVDSEPGRGTTFRLYLPAHLEPEETPAPPRDTTPPRGNGELILVVDDEESIRDVTRQTLEAFGYRVLTATDGADAVAIYGRRSPEIDLVLTDMVMPIMDGPATIRALRRMNPDVRIVGASGIGANGLSARALDSGTEHFLPKPYTAQTLLETLRQVLTES